MAVHRMDGHGLERDGVGLGGLERHGVELHRLEHDLVERYLLERDGVGFDRVELHGLERNGLVLHGLEWPNRYGNGRRHLRHGMEPHFRHGRAMSTGWSSPSVDGATASPADAVDAVGTNGQNWG